MLSEIVMSCRSGISAFTLSTCSDCGGRCSRGGHGGGDMPIFLGVKSITVYTVKDLC